MVNANLVALLALPILAAILAIYLLRVGDNVGHLFILMGAGFCVIALLPYVFNTPSDIGTILIILGLGCVAWGLTLRKRRFRWKKHQSLRSVVPQPLIQFANNAGYSAAKTPRPAHQDRRYNAHIFPRSDPLAKRDAQLVHRPQFITINP